MLASLRRLVRPADGPPLSPIRSLAYFQPVIDELLSHPALDNYLEYLRLSRWQKNGKWLDCDADRGGQSAKEDEA